MNGHVRPVQIVGNNKNIYLYLNPNPNPFISSLAYKCGKSLPFVNSTLARPIFALHDVPVIQTNNTSLIGINHISTDDSPTVGGTLIFTYI